MKKNNVLLVFIFLTLLVTTAWAEVKLIDYQGKLQKNGIAVNATALPVIFQIFNEETSNGESPIWIESQNVNVKDGLFNVKLGSETTIDETLFTEHFTHEYWLEIIVNGETLSPRQRLTSIPFAIEADNALTLSGKNVEELDQSEHVLATSNPHHVTAEQIGLDLTWGNLLNIPAGFADSIDDVGLTTESDPTVLASVKDGVSWSEIASIPAGFSDGIDNTGLEIETDPKIALNTINAIAKWNGSVLINSALIDKDGNIGVGVSTPSEKLEVNGNVKLSQVDAGVIFNDNTKQTTAFLGSGPGSGLDADTLDGLEASDFARLTGITIPKGSFIPLSDLDIDGLDMPDRENYILDGKTISSARAAFDSGGSPNYHEPKYGAVTVSHVMPLETVSSFSEWFDNPTSKDISFTIHQDDDPRNNIILLEIECTNVKLVELSYEAVSSTQKRETIVFYIESLDLISNEPEVTSADVVSNWAIETQSEQMIVRNIKSTKMIRSYDANGNISSSVMHTPLEVSGIGARSALLFWNKYKNDPASDEITTMNIASHLDLEERHNCSRISFSGLSLDEEAKFIFEKATFYCETIE